MKKLKNNLVIILILVLPIALYFILRSGQNHYKPLPVLGPPDHKIPPFELLSSDGGKINKDDLSGKVYVADFIFTACAGICPVMTSNLKKVQDAFKEVDVFEIISFTVDPETDTPEVLQQYADGQGAIKGKWHFATGEKPEIYELGRKGFMLPVEEGDGGPQDFIHSERLVLVDKLHRIRGYYDGTKSAQIDTLIGDIKLLLVSESMMSPQTKN